jgi:hypothetical protein
VIVATKLDKEKRSQHARLLKEVAAGFGLEHPDIMGSGEGMSPVNIWSRVISLL